MPLTREQLELLASLHDGQCTAPELAAANALAATAEGQAALVDLAGLTALVRSHGAARAPLGLKGRVLATLDEDYDDISRPTASILPMRRVLMLAAACLAVTVGVYFGLAVLGDPTAPQDPVARQIPAANEAQSAPVPIIRDTGGDTNNQQAGKSKDSNETGAETRRDEVMSPKAPEVPLPPVEGNWATRTVLNMDRGSDQPHQLSLELNRRGNSSALQVYADLLAVACLHADARLMDGDVATAESDNDFGIIDGMEVELPLDALPELLSALEKLAGDQQYGTLRLPADLRRPVDDTARLAEELAQLDDQPNNDPTETGEKGLARNQLELRRIQEYLPLDALRSRAPSSTGRKAGPGGEVQDGSENLRTDRPSGDTRPERPKVRLVIRLQ